MTPAEELRRALNLQMETNSNLVRQIMDLNQCVECGEMDHQDGIRVSGKFYCIGCFAGLLTTKLERLLRA